MDAINMCPEEGFGWLGRGVVWEDVEPMGF